MLFYPDILSQLQEILTSTLLKQLQYCKMMAYVAFFLENNVFIKM